MLTLCFHIYVRGKYYHHAHMRTHYVLRHSSNICFAHSFCSNSIEYWHFQHGRELQWFKATREIKNLLNKKKNSLPYKNVTHIHTHTYTLSILWFYWMENYKNWIQWNFCFLSKWQRSINDWIIFLLKMKIEFSSTNKHRKYDI